MTTEFDIKDLQSNFRKLLEIESSRERIRAAIETKPAICASLWRTISELGWPSLAIPSAHGGLDMGGAEVAALASELGRSLAVVPLLSTLIVSEAISQSGSESQKTKWLPQLAAGEAIGSLSVTSSDFAEAFGEGDELSLCGRVRFLLDGMHANVLLLFARTADGEDIAAIVERSQLSALATYRETADPTRHFAEVLFDGGRIGADSVLARGDAAVRLRDRLFLYGGLLVAMESLGAAGALLEQTLEYLKVRVAFGQPIGTFQALKHRCADHAVAIAASKAMANDALRQWASGSDEAAHRAALASAYASQTFEAMADDALQLHGGIGLTWEHDCHLFLKRAKLNRELFGSPESKLDAAFAQLACEAV